MGGEQQEGGRAAAGRGCKHPSALQLGSERAEGRAPVLGANRQLLSPQLLLPFTMCQLAAVEERAVACIGRLLAFTNTCSLPELCSCFMGTAVFQHRCQENQRFPVLGKLAGHLILSCTSTNERTRDEAMKAVHQLFTFITTPRLSLEQKEPKVPQLWERQLALLHQEPSHEKRATTIFQVLMKYLLHPETVNVLLTTIESMTVPSLHSTGLAAHMVDMLTAEARFPPRQVRKIMKTIYNSLPSIRDKAALKSLGRALLVLTSKFPKEMVSSLLVCSPTCTRYRAHSPWGSSPFPSPPHGCQPGEGSHADSPGDLQGRCHHVEGNALGAPGCGEGAAGAAPSADKPFSAAVITVHQGLATRPCPGRSKDPTGDTPAASGLEGGPGHLPKALPGPPPASVLHHRADTAGGGDLLRGAPAAPAHSHQVRGAGLEGAALQRGPPEADGGHPGAGWLGRASQHRHPPPGRAGGGQGHEGTDNKVCSPY
ncbi:uncharacterized protein LOC109369868 isoform X1 [Meleagris gallopavo]|uniref:uncharacterized protein LOC109369868 isoform X1 n=1 Tax=Meleagris gallopavo TaxID=9103 RepID=UPI0012AB616C|nr:uncharacterized protein LOC109369868 isoform X1 [Meleagris gallopavo]